MREADIVLVALPQADGRTKPRPALLLRFMPPFQDALVCGISSQLQQQVPEFDELLLTSEADFAGTGLRTDSLIRLGFLAVVSRSNILGTLGGIAPLRHQRLLQRLSDYLRP